MNAPFGMTRLEPQSSHVAVRMASIGIAVDDIAYCLRKTRDVVLPWLRQAVVDGHLRNMPAMRREDPSLTVAPDFSDADAAVADVMAALGFSQGQSKLIAALISLGTVSRPDLMRYACPRSTAVKSLDVQICKIRPRLAAHGVEITTVWGRGYRMSDTDRIALARIIKERNAKR